MQDIPFTGTQARRDDTSMGQPVLYAQHLGLTPHWDSLCSVDNTFDRYTFPVLDAQLVTRTVANSTALGMPEFKEYFPGLCSAPGPLFSPHYYSQTPNPTQITLTIGADRTRARPCWATLCNFLHANTNELANGKSAPGRFPR